MKTASKKWTRKSKPQTAKAPRLSAKEAAAAKDRQERKKVSKTLDLAGFMADFQKDKSSAAYWETAE